jgi:hypothetical protein
MAHRAMAGFFSSGTLAQVNPWDDPAPPPAPEPQEHHMSFSDLKGAMHAYNTGEVQDTGLRNGILIFIAVVAVLALILHLRLRYKSAGAPDSVARLGRELGKLIAFPLGTRLLLWWVARSVRVPFASLLLSSNLFDTSVATWAAHPNFSAMRKWGQSRLSRLRPALFS